MDKDNKIKIKSMFAALIVAFDTESVKSNPSAAEFAIALTLFVTRVIKGYGMKEEDIPIYIELINDMLTEQNTNEKKS